MSIERNLTEDFCDYTSLHDAAEYGDLPAVKYFIGKGAGVNDTNECGWTPLHYAAKEGELEVAEFLIKKGANICAEDNESKKPIHVAAAGGYINAVAFFLSKGITVDIETQHHDEKTKWIQLHFARWTPLHFAASEGQVEVAEFLIKEGADIHARGEYGEEPIHVAAAGGYINAVAFFLSKGVTVDIQTKGRRRLNDEIIKWVQLHFAGWTPLHFAASEGQVEVVKFLIKEGANIHAKGDYGEEPIHVAAAGGHTNTVAFFLNKKVLPNQTSYKHWTPLHYAASEGKVEVVKLLLKEGADIHDKTLYGEEPIHVAAARGHKCMVEFFLSRKVSIHSKTNAKWTPLHWAASEGKIEVAKFLTELGADVHAQNIYGKEPIHVASNKQVVELLLSKGVTVDVKTKNNETALHFAVKAGRQEVVECLIERGADVFIIFKRCTVLHLAVFGGNKKILELVLKEIKHLHPSVHSYINENLDAGGNTALMLAAEKCNVDAFKILLEIPEVKVHLQNKNGMTALHMAAKGGSMNIVKLLMHKVGHTSDMKKVKDKNGKTPVGLAIENRYLSIALYLKFGEHYRSLLNCHMNCALSTSHLEEANLLDCEEWGLVTVAGYGGKALHLQFPELCPGHLVQWHAIKENEEVSVWEVFSKINLQTPSFSKMGPGCKVRTFKYPGDLLHGVWEAAPPDGGSGRNWGSPPIWGWGAPQKLE